MQDLQQDALLIIHKNQQIIDALTASNSQMITMLLEQDIRYVPGSGNDSNEHDSPTKKKKVSKGRPLGAKAKALREQMRAELQEEILAEIQEREEDEQQYEKPIETVRTLKAKLAPAIEAIAPAVAISKHTGRPIAKPWSAERRKAYDAKMAAQRDTRIAPVKARWKASKRVGGLGRAKKQVKA